MRPLLSLWIVAIAFLSLGNADSKPSPSGLDEPVKPGFSVVPGAPAGAAIPNPAEQLKEGDLESEIQRLEQELQKQGGVSFDPNDPRVQQQAQQLEKLNQFLSKPIVQRLQRTITDPEFGKAAEEVVKSPNRMKLLYIQAGWLIFFLVFRAWRLTKANKFLHRVWTRTWTFAVWATMTSWVIPVAAIGDSYQKILSAFWRVVFPGS